MKFSLTIDANNSSFMFNWKDTVTRDSASLVISDLLEKVAYQIRATCDKGNHAILDINGNTVGSFILLDEEE